MPISVQCPNPDCGKTMQIKEQFAGKAGECPYCHTALMVPKVSAPAAGAETKSTKASVPPASLITVHCPHPGCGKTIRVRQEFAGKAGKCPGCGKAVMVPYPEAAGAIKSLEPEPAEKPPAPAGGDGTGLLTDDIKLAPMEGEEKEEGGFDLVEEPAEEGGFDLVEEEAPKPKPGAKPAKPALPPISVMCPACWAKMKAPAKFAGKTVKCLKCDGPIHVPAAGVDEAPPWMQPAAPAANTGPVEADWLRGDGTEAGPMHFSPFLEAAKAKKAPVAPATPSSPAEPAASEAPPPPPPRRKARVAPPTVVTTEDERHAAMLCHALAIVMSFVGPWIVWSVKRGHSRFVDDQGREVLNFQINIVLFNLVICLLTLPLWFFMDAEDFLMCLGGAALLMVLLGIGMLVLHIIGAVRAKRGVLYRYPTLVRLITPVAWDEVPPT